MIQLSEQGLRQAIVTAAATQLAHSELAEPSQRIAIQGAVFDMVYSISCQLSASYPLLRQEIEEARAKERSFLVEIGLLPKLPSTL